MSDTTNAWQSASHRGFRFSIGTLLPWFAIVALAANGFMMNYRISQMQRETASQYPLHPAEVARQFEELATVGPIKTTVKDVRFSAEADAYRVKFSWFDSTSGKTWHSGLRLNHDGFGVYIGQIHNAPFVRPLGTEVYTVAVRTPSLIEN